MGLLIYVRVKVLFFVNNNFDYMIEKDLSLVLVTSPIFFPTSDWDELEVLKELDKRVSPKLDVGRLTITLKLLLDVGDQ